MFKFTGWRAFLALWSGQAVSLVGSGLFAFAVGVWVYQRTQSATMFALILFFDMLPAVLAAPYAGVVADRMNRRTLMILGNLGAALSALLVALVAAVDPPNSQLWLLFPPLVLGGVAASFHGAAYEASLSLLVEEKHLGRANGLIQLSMGLGEILAPAIAGVLFVLVQVWALILFDVASFLVATLALLVIRIPSTHEPIGAVASGAEKRSLRDDLLYGLRYLRPRHGLLALLWIFALLNLFISVAMGAVTPMVLGFTDARGLGLIAAMGGAGLIAGGLLMTVWGGLKRRITMLLAGLLAAGFFVILYGIRPSVPLIAVGAFGTFFTVAVANAASGAIWQSQVAPQAQGRVFAVRRIVAQLSAPLGLLIVGPLIDGVFRHLLDDSGSGLFGSGSARGIGVLFVAMGVIVIVISVVAWTRPAVRGVETDAVPEPEPQPSPAT